MGGRSLRCFRSSAKPALAAQVFEEFGALFVRLSFELQVGDDVWVVQTPIRRWELRSAHLRMGELGGVEFLAHATEFTLVVIPSEVEVSTA